MTTWKPKSARRRKIYYKVQVFDPVSLSWRDERSAHDELSDAQNHIAQALAGKNSRIMVVEGTRRVPLKP